MIIRRARAADAPAIHDIYAHYVLNTAITFATHAPSAQEYAAHMADLRYPFLAAEEDGIAGFAYAASFREKEAYRWDVELTIYLAPGQEKRGTGSLLMAELLRLLSQQGYLNAYSCITLPNEGSIRLHRRFGFDELGVFPRSGFKLNRWHDVIWLGKALGECSQAPQEPRPLPPLTETEENAR